VQASRIGEIRQPEFAPVSAWSHSGDAFEQATKKGLIFVAYIPADLVNRRIGSL